RQLDGVTVDTADSAAVALERVAARDYDAIVADIKMPGMDGLELLAEIRTRRPDTPTLMITGHGDNHLVVGRSPGRGLRLHPQADRPGVLHRRVAAGDGDAR